MEPFNHSLSKLLDNLQQLNLSTFVNTVQQLMHEDPEKAAVVLPLLASMAHDELCQRKESLVKRRIKNAQFVRIQTVDSFDFNYTPSTRKLKKRYLQLLNAGPVEKAVGAIFLGNAGLGKTHLARALGYAACQRGHKVLFIPCATLLNRLVAADVSKILHRQVKYFESQSLLIIDELGYLTMSHQEANLFFQVLSRRHDRDRPTVVTTNKPFGEWNQVFHGDSTAHVIVDRLTEQAEIFYLEGKASYRQTHRKGLNAEKPNKRTPKS